MKITALAFILFLSGCTTYRVVVVDENGSPVESANVTIQEMLMVRQGNSKSGLTDKNGIFQAKLLDTAVMVSATKDGYHPVMGSPYDGRIILSLKRDVDSDNERPSETIDFEQQQ